MRVPRQLPSVLARLAILPAVSLWGVPALAAKIACVGDSITYGYGLNNRDKESYPTVLQTLVGTKDIVQNFGTSGCTLLKKGDKPYWNDSNFGASDAFKPDVVILMLGTNDAKPQNWSFKSDFEADYQSLIEHYRSNGAAVYAAVPPPVYPPGAFSIDPTVLTNEVAPLVRQIAAKANAPLIDVFQALSNQSSLFPDTVHPNAAGARLIAETVALALNAGGAAGSTGAAGTSSNAGGGSGRAGRGGSAGAAGSVAAAGRGMSSGVGGAAATGGSRAATGSGAIGGAPLGQGGSSSAMGGRVAAGGLSVDSTGVGGVAVQGGSASNNTAKGGSFEQRGGSSATQASGGTESSSFTADVARGGNGASNTTASSNASSLGGSRASSAVDEVVPTKGESGCSCRTNGKKVPDRGLGAAFGLALLDCARRWRSSRTGAARSRASRVG